MKWTVFFLTSMLTGSTLSSTDQYDPQPYSEPYQYPVVYRRQGFDLLGDGGSLGIIGVGAIAGIIAGGVAVAQAANARTTIQNNINTLSTRANTLQTSADSITNTLMMAQTIATTNTAEANAVCSFITAVGAVTAGAPGAAATGMDNAMALDEIRNAAMNVQCIP